MRFLITLILSITYGDLCPFYAKFRLEKRCEDGLLDLYISWFGGEPLMALEVVEEIELFRKKMLEKFPAMFRVRSGMTTNGYLLTPDVLARLVDLGVKDFQITLDGPPDHHNKTRLRADGAGTYDVIFGNLISASETNLDFNIDIRMHLHSSNINAVQSELTDILIKNFAHDGRFKLHPRSIADYGGAFNDGHVKTTNYINGIDAMSLILHRFNSARKSLNKEISVLSEPSLLDAVNHSSSEGSGFVCYAAASNSFGIRADGSLVKCTTALDEDNNKIGHIKETGELDINQELIKLWMGGFAAGKNSQLACPLYVVKTLPKKNQHKTIPISAI
ncbi:MAG: hypothetical protein HYZ65_01975 [Burkholderiales bacterium]|nr:hypothetical protein [Burkholderiales bacterium]